MKGKLVLVTGASAGMGKETATQLARQGAAVALLCRNEQKGRQAQRDISAATGNDNIELYIADLASQRDIGAFVEQFRAKHERLDVLVNNAGGVFGGGRSLTKDGIELNVAVNHLSAFMLSALLLEPLKQSGQGRIVNVASTMMAKQPDMASYKEDTGLAPLAMYGQAKLAMIMTGYALARRLAGTNVTVNALHPGFVKTEQTIRFMPSWTRPLLGLFALTPQQGAQTAIDLAASPDVASTTGRYFVKSKEKQTVPVSYDEAMQEQLWAYSEQLTGVNV